MARKSGVQASELQKRIGRIKFAERIRNEADEKYGYSKHIKMYGGDFKSVMPSWLTGIDLVPINEVYAYVKTFIPSVYSRDPYICINPKGKRYIVGSKIMELAINGYWRELKLKRQIRRAIFDAIFAEGYIKVGYTASLGKNDDKDAKMLFPSEYIKDQSIFAQRVSFKNIVRDPDAVDGLHDSRWYAHQIILPLSAVKGNSLYENTDKLTPNYTMELSGPPGATGDTQYKTEEEYVVLWEEWNRDEEMVYTYAEGCDSYLMNKKWPYKFDGFNLEMLRFNECQDEPYAPNLIGPWEAQLWEKMKIRSMELDHIKRFGRQLVCEKGSLSRVEKDKFKKGITGSLIEYEKSSKNPPMPIPYPPIQTDIYAIENRIDMDKDTISGQPNVVRSAPQKTQSRTLGELQSLIAAFGNRQHDPQAITEEFSEAVAGKIIGLMQQYFTKDKYIKASSLDAQWLMAQMQDNPEADRFDESGFLMKKSDIADLDFEVDIRAGSSLPLDKENRMKAMTSLVEVGPAIGIIPGSKTAKIVGKNLLADYDMPEIDAAFQEDIQKMEAAEQTAQMAQMMKGQLLEEQMAREAQRVKMKMAQGQNNGV